uniref:Uncharacterized protein n=1 Tax=Rhizophora mucronata TaxID=61149 RepID=A0A2P2PB92_RHIMU
MNLMGSWNFSPKENRVNRSERLIRNRQKF